uniref:Uncharacterized protein n=1 Tax=Anguilla anguilla TaxID=7936 RepID=A0A0E9X5T8_ANGAN
MVKLLSNAVTLHHSIRSTEKQEFVSHQDSGHKDLSVLELFVGKIISMRVCFVSLFFCFCWEGGLDPLVKNKICS